MPRCVPMTRPLLLTLIVLLTALLGACDSPGGSQSLAPDALQDTHAPGDTLAGTDTDRPPADTSQPPADTSRPVDTTPSGPSPVGVGVLLSEIDSAFLNLAFVSARLTRAVPPLDTSGTYHGACRVTTVDPDAPTGGTYGLDAGTITVSGTTPAVTFTAASEGAYGTGYTSNIADDLQNLLPSGGAILTVSGSGGADIAAFSGALQTPEPVTIGLPETGITEKVDPTRNLTVTWNKGTGESVLVSLTPVDNTGNPVEGKAAFCLAIGDPGSLEVPKSALIELTGHTEPTMALGVTRTRTGSASTPGHRVPFTATRSSGGPVRLVPP